MSQPRTVSAILLEDHHLSIRPGGKGECPFCHRNYFSIKADDTLGKCFEPTCGRYLTLGHAQGSYAPGIAQVLQAVYQDMHQDLGHLASGAQNAYTYLRDERGIHAEVIAQAMVGSVPSSYDVTPHFQPVIAAAKDALATVHRTKRGRPGKQLDQAQQRLDALEAAHQKLVDCFAHRAGWLVFFYTNSQHRPVAVRLRQPYSRTFVSFKPGIAGVFGRELFTPYTSKAHQAANAPLLVTEGELNVLQLQSLTLRVEEATGQSLGFVHCCAVGGVTLADVDTLTRVGGHPVVCYDHDANGAGFELVKMLQKAMPLDACTTPEPGSDLDSFISDFGADHSAAWEAVKGLIATKQPYGRVYSGTGSEFFRPTRASKEFIPKWLGDALMARETYVYTAEHLWVYQGGVYLACGEATLRADAQRLLGEERREHYLEEALRYVEVATLREDESPPDAQYINVRNGRLDWATGALEGHTSQHFTTTQFPVDYKPTASCPAFDNYLITTFDADVRPLIEEILGWCLVPDHRFEHVVMISGEGANGKSVFLDLVSYLLGEANVSSVALQDLEENRFRAAELFGKAANVFADLDTRGLQSSTMLKTLTTGDKITAERKHGQPFSFRSYAKLLFSANKIPSSRDKTYAFYRRWLILPFTKTFDGSPGNPAPDKGLRGKLKDELSGVLNHALSGLTRLAMTEAFSQPKSVLEAKQAYIRANDNVRVFVDECVIAAKDAPIVKKEFYLVYENWCERYGERAVSQKALKEVLKQIIPPLDEWRDQKNSRAPWCWLGIEWSTDASRYMPPSLQVAHASDDPLA